MKNYYVRTLLFYSFLTLTLLPTATVAQDCERPWKFAPVCGKIIDYDTGLPIAGAQIIGDPTCAVTTTNSNSQGYYCLNLNCCQGCETYPPIRYNNFVTVKASGYCLIRTRPINGHVDSVNFYLSRNCNCNRTNDSLALVQMSNALNLNWPITQPLSNSNAWGGGSPGLFMSENLCVVGINMKPGYGVIANGTLPAAFSTLTGLEEFDSEGNNVQFLSGTLPDMSNFKNLNTFRLSKSKITGGLPASFGQLKNLTVLTVIDNTNLGGTIPPELGNARELGNLILFNNNFVGTIPTELGNLKKLFVFYVNNNNNLSGTIPTGFGTCDSLRHFFVDNCNLTGRDGQIDFLFRLPRLQYLGLSGNKFSGTIPTVPATPVNPNWSFINLNDNLFDSLPPLTCRRFMLSARNNKLTFDDILPNLTYFDVNGQTCVSDAHKTMTSYAPQDSIGTEKTITPPLGVTLTIDELKIDGALTTNRYQWFKNGIPYGGVLNSNKLIIPNFQAADAGVYTCQVTNPAAPLLTLYSRKITIISACIPPNTPSIGQIIQTSCTDTTGSVVLNGLPAGTWTLTRNPDNITSTGTGLTTTIANLRAGTYTFSVASTANCTSLPSTNVVINVPPTLPSAPSVSTVTQTTCLAQTGSITLSGLPTTGTWTLTRNPGNVTSTGTGATTTISNLAAGTYTFTITNATGCSSLPSANVVINASAITTPIVGTITQPTCTIPTSSVVLSGLPALGTWTLTRNPDGVATTGTGTTTTVYGLPIGTYTFTVTNASNCVSSATSSILINAASVNPNAPIVGKIIAPPCDSATGSVLLSGLPATGTWSINPKGQTGTGSTATIKGLTEGTYTYTVTNDKGCTSSSSIVVVTCIKDNSDQCLVGLSDKIPNGFTPGGNGTNDYFDPEKYLSIAGCSNNIKAEELYIMNRWGEVVFKSQPYQRWDGKSGNQQKTAPTSAYYYILVLKVGDVRQSIKGVINLFAD